MDYSYKLLVLYLHVNFKNFYPVKILLFLLKI
jgi:hypothetical protein